MLSCVEKILDIEESMATIIELQCYQDHTSILQGKRLDRVI